MVSFVLISFKSKLSLQEIFTNIAVFPRKRVSFFIEKLNENEISLQKFH